MSSPGPPSSPRHDLTSYKPTKIKDLIVGPALIQFQGRIVNLVHRPWSQSEHSSTADSKPAGYFRLIVSDGTGVIVVKLFYASDLRQVLYLGSLVAVCTTHISPQDPGLSTTTKHPGYFVSIFPGRDETVAFEILDGSEENAVVYRVPLGYHPGLKYLRCLQTLRDVVRMERQDEQTPRVLVVVKSILPSRIISYKKNDAERVAQVVEVVVRDSTDEATLALWDYCIESVRRWKAGETVLMITQPTIADGASLKKKIILGPTSTIDVDPETVHSTDLRSWASMKMIEESTNLPFPSDEQDLEVFHQSELKIGFTLGDIDSFVKAKEDEPYLGYFAFVILELNLVKLYGRKMLCSGDCCGISLFANSIRVTCLSCGRQVDLRLNPSIIGTLADETGSMCGQKVV